MRLEWRFLLLAAALLLLSLPFAGSLLDELREWVIGPTPTGHLDLTEGTLLEYGRCKGRREASRKLEIATGQGVRQVEIPCREALDGALDPMGHGAAYVPPGRSIRVYREPFRWYSRESGALRRLELRGDCVFPLEEPRQRSWFSRLLAVSGYGLLCTALAGSALGVLIQPEPSGPRAIWFGLAFLLVSTLGFFLLWFSLRL